MTVAPANFREEICRLRGVWSGILHSMAETWQTPRSQFDILARPKAGGPPLDNAAVLSFVALASDTPLEAGQRGET